MKKYKNVGRHPWRLKPSAANPEEVRFAEAWDEKNQEKGYLAYLLDPNNRGDESHTTERDREVAATVIQWLGSPVGRTFLKEVGYVDKETAVKGWASARLLAIQYGARATEKEADRVIKELT